MAQSLNLRSLHTNNAHYTLTTGFTIQVKHGSYESRQCFEPGVVNSAFASLTCSVAFQQPPPKSPDYCGVEFYNIGSEDVRCEPLQKLGEYGVFITSADSTDTNPTYSVDAWDIGQIQDILNGTVVTASALHTFSDHINDPVRYTSGEEGDKEAFKAILMFNDSQRIDFRMRNDDSIGCSTTKKDSESPVRASITCGEGLISQSLQLRMNLDMYSLIRQLMLHLS